jgi:hypothetical protein
MTELALIALAADDAAGGAEDPAATRARLKGAFPPGATRRMTQLGMLVSALLDTLEPTLDDAVVYASSWAETRALESYLDSFPTPSPTLFQTSIHPSAVQQGRILRQRPVREFFPLTGGVRLPWAALRVAATCAVGASRVLLCGGEERGTYLLEHEAASPRTFAFALALTSRPVAAPLGRVALVDDATVDSAAALPLAAWFDALRTRAPLDAPAAPGGRVQLTWS